VTRQVQAIRFRNQSFTLHITDPTQQATARHDRPAAGSILSVYPYAFASTWWCFRRTRRRW
jgi:hypothetical protein